MPNAADDGVGTPPVPKITVLKKSREGFKLNVRNVLTSVTNAYVNRESTPTDSRTLQDYSDRLSQYERMLDSLDEQIAALMPEDEIADEASSAAIFRETVWRAYRDINDMLDLQAPQSPSLPPSGPARQHASHSSPSPATANAVASFPQTNAVRLPKLELPKFDGNPLQFQEFWDFFDATIHSQNMPNVEKMKYLKRALIGEAADMARNYRLTNDMYDQLVDKLKQRFGNMDVVIAAHLEQLLALKNAESGTRSLQHTFDECDRHVRSLIALGLSEDEFGKVFAPIILSKMPWSIRREMNKVNKSASWTMDKLRDSLREEIEARQMADRSISDKVQKSGERPKWNQQNHQTNQYNKTRSAEALAYQTADMKKANVVCAFCGANHFSDVCTKVTDLAERKKIAIERRLCFNCLGTSHPANKCTRAKPCYYCRKKGHHSSLCLSKKNEGHGMFVGGHMEGAGSTHTENRENTDTSLVSNATVVNSRKGHVYMQMASVKLKTPKGPSVTARLLFDTGSTCSYITTKLQRQLQLKTAGCFNLANARFEDTARQVKSYPAVTLLLPTSDSIESTHLSLFVTDHISCNVQKQPIDLQAYPSIRNLKLADAIAEKPEFHEVDILVGADHYYDIIRDHQIRLSDGFVLLDSKLGYIPAGCLRSSRSEPHQGCTFVSCFLNASPEAMLHVGRIERFWHLEEIGIKDDAVTPDDDIAVAQFEKSIQEIDGRLTVGWPWKADAKSLPENRDVALARLHHLIRRIGSKECVITAYDGVIRDQLANGIIEEVPNESERTGIVHYLPHHEVVRSDHSTTKLRVVYDGSAKRDKGQPSLNDCLLRGPVLLSDLCGLLLRFRTRAFAFTADIEKAYLQVGLHVKDRDATRFFWLRDTKLPPKPPNVVVYRFTRVLFGIISSAFLLDATIRYKMREVNTEVSLAIAENTYVDNVASGTDTEAKAVDFFHEAIGLFEQMSMNLRAWRTNSKELQVVIPEEIRAKATDAKVLGLTWDCERDELGFQPPRVSSMVVLTKRNLLQAGSRLFDPCGFLAPVCIKVKLLVQDLWRIKLLWDDAIPDETRDDWAEICNEVDLAAQLKIPRHVAMDPPHFELHAFCDASAKVFASVVYARPTNVSSETQILMCKARLAPLKAVTIPRLELMAVVVGVRLLSFVMDQLFVPRVKCYIWSDSKCVLHWIKSVKVLSVFVENRVKEIRTSGIECRYVPTEVNPADLPTKGMRASELQTCRLWWHGPEFLKLAKSEWPECSIPDPEEQDDAMEEQANVSVDQEMLPKPPFEFELSRFSSLESLVAATAWAKRFVNNARISHSGKPAQKGRNLSLAERLDALLTWVVHVQQLLMKDKSQFRNTSKQLDLFEDDRGFWRCGGRMRNAELTHDAKFPILLPKSHRFTDLVIAHAHAESMHMGPVHTLAQVRTRFWIPQGLVRVKMVIKSCPWCRIWNGTEFKLPKTAPLPSFRASKSPPFRTVGVDHLGPLFTSNTGSEHKVWICLFTCAVTRAIHLEVVNSPSGDQFLLCFRRLVANYGCPTQMISDNAKCFKLAEKVLGNSKRTQLAVEWKFIPEFSPWFGGFYERMVGSVKRALRKALGRQLVSLPVLQTIVCEIAALVNTIPLTFSNDVHDEILTPAHLLGKESAVARLLDIPMDNTVSSSGRKELIDMYVQRMQVLQGFWPIWQSDYLTALRSTHKSIKNALGSTPLEPKLADVVLIKGDKSRVTWPLGIIEQLHKSNDGAVRSAKVRLGNGSTRVRPVNMLIPLETDIDVDGGIPRATSIKTDHAASGVDGGPRRATPIPSSSVRVDDVTHRAAPAPPASTDEGPPRTVNHKRVFGSFDDAHHRTAPPESDTDESSDFSDEF